MSDKKNSASLDLGFENLIVWAGNTNYFGCAKKPDNRSKYIAYTSDSQDSQIEKNQEVE